MGNFSSGSYNENFIEHLSRFIGETVTIFTTSGGESGSGFTGVVLFVNSCFVRLITKIGPAPGCSIGNSCSCRNRNRFDGNDIRTVGAVADIPIDRIACFVHNAV